MRRPALHWACHDPLSYLNALTRQSILIAVGRHACVQRLAHPSHVCLWVRHAPTTLGPQAEPHGGGLCARQRVQQYVHAHTDVPTVHSALGAGQTALHAT
jgi:hypothetical protein